MKIETITLEYEHCGECSHCDMRDGKWVCLLTGRKVANYRLWHKPIPDWCPLPDKEDTKIDK